MLIYVPLFCRFPSVSCLCSRWYKDDLCALAFKVLHDKQRGPLVFLRIYSGTLKPQTAVHNINRNSTYVAARTHGILSDLTNKNKKLKNYFLFFFSQRRSERMSRLLVPFADQHVEIPSMTAGNIALTVGLKQVENLTHHPSRCSLSASWSGNGLNRFPLSVGKTVTGDTIVSSKASAAAAVRRAHAEGGRTGSKHGEQASVVLSGVEVPDPVFFCTIEPPTMAKQAGQ